MSSVYLKDDLKKIEVKVVEEFLKGLKEKAGLEYDEQNEIGRKQLGYVHKFISRLLINYRLESTPNVITRNCHSGEYMCNVLITAGVTFI